MRVLGLDGGIASIGWALIDIEEAHGRIVAAGARTFDAPETDKERTPTNAIRRQKRLARRTLRRRRQRMAALRELLAAHGLLDAADREALRRPGLDPWRLRAQGLERRLEPAELAVALGHIARHRGFWSNSKRDRGENAPPDDKKMLGAIAATQAKLARWRTPGEMLALDPEFAERKRNRTGDYGRTMLRDDLRRETRMLFEAQRRLGNALATETLETAYAPLAFDQLPLQDSEHLLGACPFEPDQRRTARRAYSFELFRLLSKLAHTKLLGRGWERNFTADEIARVTADFGGSKGITYRAMRKLLDLSPDTRFADVTTEDEKNDITSRHGQAAAGTATLREIAGSAWDSLRHTPARLDRIAEVLTFRESLPSIRAGLEEAGVEPPLLDALLSEAEAGKLAAFKGAAHISANAARAILPHLRRGLVYSEACAEAGYDHATRPATDLKDVKNPVARKALGEMIKQVRAIIHEYGKPDRIHLELARDVGKSADERSKLTKGIEDRNKVKNSRRIELAEKLARPVSDEELLRYELWHEQGGFCLYSGKYIHVPALAASDNSVQVDHILPWSRFGDDSFVNKTLCYAAENQHKRNRTPYEWIVAERPSEWERFERQVSMCPSPPMKRAKKTGFYLRRNAEEVEKNFRDRNLNDTRYACRLLLDVIGRWYPKPTGDQRYVYARPGKVTAMLRRGWGLEGLKKDANGKRLEDDRHHALDAIVVAATTESMLNRLTSAFQEAKQRGSHRDFSAPGQPWEGFRSEVDVAMKAVFVSREERRRVPGEKHAATLKQVRRVDGATLVFEKRDIFKLTEKDLGCIKDADRNVRIVESLRSWFRAGRPKDELPMTHAADPTKRHPIRKVRVQSQAKPGVLIRSGKHRPSTADNGKISRVDVFSGKSARGRAGYYVVPVYPHQVALSGPPMLAVVPRKNETDWIDVGYDFKFLFSLYPNSLVSIAKSNDIPVFAYYRGFDRWNGAIQVASPHASTTEPIGVMTLRVFRKFAVDRFGRTFEVPAETRTWHGVVCT